MTHNGKETDLHKPLAKEDRINPRALTAVLIVSIVEYEVFTFSKTTVAAARQDAWLACLLGAAVGLIFVYFLVRLAARFPGQGYFEYLPVVWGRPLGFFMALCYPVFWLLYLTALFYETSMANKLLFLPRAPKIVPLLVFAFCLFWLISYGVTPIVRFFQLMLPFLVVPLLLLTLLFIPAIHLDNFKPVLAGGPGPVAKGAFLTLGVFQGPEVLLFLAPFITQIGQGFRPALLGFAVPAFIGWTSVAAALGVLGVRGVQEALLPGINVVTLIELPGFPVERFGLLLTLPWLVAIFTTMAIYLYLLGYGTLQFLHLPGRKWTLGAAVLLPLAISYFIPSAVWHEHLRMIIMFATLVLVYALPVLTLAAAVVRKKGAGR